MVGSDYVAKAPADGYTMLLGTTQIIQAPALIKKLPYDVFKELTPVSQIALSSIVLIVPAQQPYKSVKDLIDAAKKGSKLTYGSFGNGTTPYLYGELLNKRAGDSRAPASGARAMDPEHLCHIHRPAIRRARLDAGDDRL